MNYSIEQIEAAVQKVTGGDSLDDWAVVITELIKPQWTPQVGEVYFYSYLEDDQPTGSYELCHNDDYHVSSSRPLTPSEVPAWLRDKEALKVAMEAL